METECLAMAWLALGFAMLLAGPAWQNLSR